MTTPAPVDIGELVDTFERAVRDVAYSESSPHFDPGRHYKNEERDDAHKTLMAAIGELRTALTAEAKYREWRPIDTAPFGESILLWAKEWQHAGEGQMDDDGYAYTPVDGSELSPPPTHWMPLPEGPK